jgi:pimeloyl-ACP methyl ester carboxylesterase
VIEHTVRTARGRKLQVREEGDPKGRPVFALHGTPGSRVLYGPIAADAEKKRIRLISYDRPGYGGSTPQPGRRIGDTADDVAAIADALRIDRFGVWGHSGGGAPALACAARLEGRVVGACSLSGVAPYPAEGLDWLAGTGELNVDDFQLMIRDRKTWESKSRKDRDEMLGWDAPKLRAGFASLCSEVDRRALTDEVVSFLLAQGHEGLRPGDEGMRDDSLATIQPWGFDLTKIHVPVQVWHGGQDRFVPITHGQWLAARIPNVDAHLEQDQGHLTVLLNRVPLAQSWLAARF